MNLSVNHARAMIGAVVEAVREFDAASIEERPALHARWFAAETLVLDALRATGTVTDEDDSEADYTDAIDEALSRR